MALVAIATVVYIGVICLSHPSFNDSALVVGRRGLYETTLTMPHTQVFPSYTDRLVDVWYPMEVTDQPFFWYIPKAGGLTFQKICAQCLNLVSASAKGNDTYNPVSGMSVSCRDCDAISSHMDNFVYTSAHRMY